MARSDLDVFRLEDDTVLVWRCPACLRAHETPIVIAPDGHRYNYEDTIDLKCDEDQPGWPVFARFSINALLYALELSAPMTLVTPQFLAKRSSQ